MNLPTKPTHLYVNHTYLTSTQVGSRPENQNRVKKNDFLLKFVFFTRIFELEMLEGQTRALKVGL